MKRLFILFFGLFLTAAGAFAQIAINNSSSAADPSAILDVSSTTKGVLIPRMTRTQIEAVSNPANGLMVFNTDDHKFYIYISAKSIWREVAYAGGTVVAPATFTMSCSTVSVNGTYASGVTLDASNNITLDVDVTATGDWSITTNTVNGYHFVGGGTFTTTGTQTVTLTGSGTPQTGQTDTFTATASNGGGTCTFDVTVMGTVTSQGQIWLDRNLGATEVATSKTDANAYGDLYQWGRAAEGHQKRNSSTTSTLATTAQPNQGNTWDGKFITNTSSPYDWLSTQDNSLWQGVNGTNNPCPSGFRVPTMSEWHTEYDSWTNQNDDGAFASPLKLSNGGWRDGNGNLTNVDGEGDYWSSTIDGSKTKLFYYDSNGTNEYSARRVDGISVRCIKDQ